MMQSKWNYLFFMKLNNAIQEKLHVKSMNPTQAHVYFIMYSFLNCFFFNFDLLL